MVDALSFREAMGRFPTGVTIVTARDPGDAPVGLTVSAFTSVSLEPPLVLVCVAATSNSHDVLLDAGRFTINVLADDQTDLAYRFATAPSEERFTDTAWVAGGNEAPRLEGVAAWLECELEEVHRGGDHSILIGRVVAVGTSEREALVYHRGAFGVFSP